MFLFQSENFHQSEIKSALANIMKRAVQRMIESSGAMSETTTETNEIEATDGPKVRGGKEVGRGKGRKRRRY